MVWEEKDYTGVLITCSTGLQCRMPAVLCWDEPFFKCGVYPFLKITTASMFQPASIPRAEEFQRLWFWITATWWRAERSARHRTSHIHCVREVTCASCQDIKLNCVATSSTGYFFPSLSISRVLLIADKCESCRTSCLREHILFPSSHRSSPPIHLLEFRQGRAKSHRTGANHLKQKSQKQNPNQSPDIKSSVRVYFKHLYFSQLSWLSSIT